MKNFTVLVFAFCYSPFLLAQNAPGIEWQTSFGGSDFDKPYSIELTNDGGYIIAGYSNSTDGDVTGNHGHDDD